MKKRNYWPLFFIGIFSFTFSMIVYTITSSLKMPVQEEDAFLKSYHDVKADFNKILEANEKFSKQYDFKLLVNNKEFSLKLNDIFASQRELAKKSTHRDILNLGTNDMKLEVRNKQTNELQYVDIKLRVTKATNHSGAIDFVNDNFKVTNNTYKTNFEIPQKGNWNITGNFKVGDEEAFFYVKTSAM